MGYPTKVQVIKRLNSRQWYINLPSALAQAIEIQKGEVVEWILDDQKRLVLQRGVKSVGKSKKKLNQKKSIMIGNSNTEV